MGGQNAAMRRIGVVGLPTANVVTTTLTGLLADIAAARPGPRLGRRLSLGAPDWCRPPQS
jgi:hypothetical protein